MTVLLVDAIKPNLLQTLEGGPAFVHCGPFANIAHGNNSILADRLALATNEAVCTEAGFGADMGAEKFFDIKCRASGLRPDAVVIVATIRALKMHGGVGRIVAGKPLDPALAEENVDAVRRGSENLAKQVENIGAFNVPTVVAINAFPTDTPGEVAAIQEVALAAGARDAVVATHWAEGGRGAEALARAVWSAAEEGAPDFRLLYPDDAPLRDKIEAIATRIYGAAGVEYQPVAAKALRLYEELGFGHLPGLHGQDAVLAEPRRDAQGPTDRASSCRSARCACPPGPASSRRSAARCGRCRGCHRSRAARTSTSTPTGTSSACSESPARFPAGRTSPGRRPR